ncbi:hypothetical protein KCK33_003517 [Salmonella enterica]|nr:hypothetical protein [Salmonella enterica]EGA0603428.1 hypothetical protein [Salmonella enterica]EHD2148898.1 hypothetical protein [Salmonella enterica]EHK2353387.1 hypothetical protein [Salmonella enterica]
MPEEIIVLLIGRINNPNIRTLMDIAEITYPAFLRKTENSLTLEESHYLYQRAIHCKKEPPSYGRNTSNNKESVHDNGGMTSSSLQNPLTTMVTDDE